jgi:ribonuclease HII
MRTATTLSTSYSEDADTFEIGIDEAGRGPLFGPVYTAAVVLPKPESGTFRHEDMKDSKRFHSKKKLHQTAMYIQSIEPTVVDAVNIRQAVFQGMHAAIQDVMGQLHIDKNCLLLVDGNDFLPYTIFDPTTNTLRAIPHVTISILAKDARDAYIADLCVQHPDLITRYGLDTNMGYGTQRHLEGIRQFGITEWHRKTFSSIKKK